MRRHRSIYGIRRLFASAKHIRNIIDYIGAEKEEKALLSAHSITLNKAIDANIRHGVNMLKLSEPLLKNRVASGKLKIRGAVYELESGIVTMMPESLSNP